MPNTALSPDAILQLGMSFWSAKALLSAVELGVFTELAGNPLDAETLATRLRLHPRGARDFFDALVALRMLERSDELYSNTPETDHFLDRNKESYIGGLLEIANTRLYHFWDSLTEALRTGMPQNATIGEISDLFAGLYIDPAGLKRFLQAMTGISLGAATAIAQKFPWSEYRTVIAIGAAQGAVPVQLALAHPHLTGGGFDLPRVRPAFEEYVNGRGLSHRLRFYPGDFCSDALPGADVLVIGRILHAWDLTTKKMLLKKAWRALPRGGALIIYETLIDDERRKNSFGLLMSLNMLIETSGGFDYTGADCMAWMKEAGFTQSCVEPLTGADSMVVGIK